MSVFVRTLWLCGAAVSLSRRRSLRRGTPGHDGFPRTLGIMRPHHHTNPVGVTTRKKPGFFGSQAFLFMSLFVRTLWLCGAVPMGEGGKVFQKSWFLNLTSPQTVGIVLSVSVIGAVVARFVHTEEVTGSNPVSRTKEPPFQGTGVLLCPPPAHPPQRLLNPADRSAAPPRERQPRHGPTTNEVPP